MRKVQSAALLIFLAVTVLLGNAGMMLSILARPFSKRLFRAINRQCAAWWWRLAVGCYHHAGVRVIYSGDRLPDSENAIVIANHQCMPDVIVLLELAERKKMLQHLKWMAKAPLKHLPGIGWGLAFLDSVFLRRNWADDADRIRATFAGLIDNKLPFWLMIFPEGTRLTPQKLARSQNYARKKGLSVPQHVQLPRTKGFVASVQGLGSQAGAVYDVTLAYEGGAPSVWEFYQGRCRQVHMHVERFPIDDLPADSVALGEWLQKRYQSKEQRLALFHCSGRLGAPSG